MNVGVCEYCSTPRSRKTSTSSKPRIVSENCGMSIAVNRVIE